MTRLTNQFFITRREDPNDETMISSKLLIKSGMIYKQDNGVYSYLPFGLKVVNNIKKIIDEELAEIESNELLLPTLVSSESIDNAYNIFDRELFNIIDRNNKEYILCPSHEEIYMKLSKSKIQSYKDLHFSLYQTNHKYRDEFHSELGLIRKKEFYMTDAMSFDADESGLDVSYDKMFQSFKHVFNRLGLNTTIVNTSKNKSELTSEEFQVLNDRGDNEIVMCPNCGFTSDRESVICKNYTSQDKDKLLKMELYKTPNVKTVKEVSEFLNIDSNKIIKSLIIKVDETYKMILLRGESELNIYKLRNLFKTRNIEIPSSEELENIGTYAGFVGPIKSTMEIIADSEVKYMIGGVCGANKKNYHYINVIPGRDFRVNRYCDLKLFDENSLCPKCKSKCEIKRGIEVGEISKIGTLLSKKYNVKYADEKNALNYVLNGYYKIGIDRCISSIVEEYHDDKGIIWPMNVAPFKVCIVISNVNDKLAYDYAMKLSKTLENENIETLVDDRKETIGVKFADMDLIGVPIRITLGSRLKNSEVEIKLRDENETIVLNPNVIVKTVKNIIKNKSNLEY